MIATSLALIDITLLALFFSSCGSLFGPSSNAGFDVREYDVDIEGPFLFTNGQKLVLSEKCYYKGSGNYECGLAALGLVTSTSNVSHRPDGSSGSVHRYHNGTMDFSNVKRLHETLKDGQLAILNLNNGEKIALDDRDTLTIKGNDLMVSSDKEIKFINLDHISMMGVLDFGKLQENFNLEEDLFKKIFGDS